MWGVSDSEASTSERAESSPVVEGLCLVPFLRPRRREDPDKELAFLV